MFISVLQSPANGHGRLPISELACGTGYCSSAVVIVERELIAESGKHLRSQALSIHAEAAFAKIEPEPSSFASPKSNGGRNSCRWWHNPAFIDGCEPTRQSSPHERDSENATKHERTAGQASKLLEAANDHKIQVISNFAETRQRFLPHFAHERPRMTRKL